MSLLRAAALSLLCSCSLMVSVPEPAASGDAGARGDAGSDAGPAQDAGSTTDTGGQSDAGGEDAGPRFDTGPLPDNLPPDPAEIAPEIDPSAQGGPLADRVAFLYTGDDPIQRGADADSFVGERVAVLRGTVTTREGAPLPGARIEIAEHPEWGHTISRADGAYDLAVNGGGWLHLRFTMDGRLPALRKVLVPWSEFAWVDPVALIGLDPVVTTVPMGSETPVLVEGSVVEDHRGARQLKALFRAGTTAEMVLPDGSRRPLDQLSVRATEFTVGEGGPAAMPAPLSARTAYTYAVELSVDEAMEAGATSVAFNQPVSVFLDNFDGFPTATRVPVAYLDRELGSWLPTEPGRIIEVDSVADGLARVKITRADRVATDEELAEYGFDEAELRRLAAYAPGTTLTRFRVEHFTPFDCNYPGSPPRGARSPEGGRGNNRNDRDGDGPGSDPNDGEDGCGSWIGCEGQVLGETIPIAGTDYGLHYRSNRVPGWASGRRVRVPATGDEVHEHLLRVRVVLRVAGQRHVRNLDPEPNQEVVFDWDGDDAYGRAVPGHVGGRVKITYFYRMVANIPPELGEVWNLPGDDEGQFFVPGLSVPMRTFYDVTLNNPIEPEGLGGWSVTPVHRLGSDDTLRMGDGSQRDLPTPAGVIQRIVRGEDVPREGPVPGHPGWIEALFVAPDGTTYVGGNFSHLREGMSPNHNGFIFRVGDDGSLEHMAGVAGDGMIRGDGGAASEAGLGRVWDIDMDADGRLLILSQGEHAEKQPYQGTIREGFYLRAIEADGTIVHVGGDKVTERGYVAPRNGVSGGPDNCAHIKVCPASETALGNELHDIAVDAEGVIYLLAGSVIRAIRRDGMMFQLAGQPWSYHALTGEARDNVRGLSAGPDGSLYFVSQNRAWRLGPGDPRPVRVMGSGRGGSFPDGPIGAEVMFLTGATDTAVDVDGNLFVAGSGGVWRLARGGRIAVPVAGAGSGRVEDLALGDAAVSSGGLYLRMDRIAAHPDGGLRAVQSSAFSIFTLGAHGWPSTPEGERILPGPRGLLGFVVDGDGRHSETVHMGLGGAEVLSMTYDEQGRLTAIEGPAGRGLTIEHRDDGATITADRGEVTTLSYGADGRLSAAAVAGGAYAMAYDDSGLLQSFSDPVGQAWAFTYDEQGRLIQDDRPGARQWTLARELVEGGSRVTMTDAAGLSTAYTTSLDEEGRRIVRVEQPDGRWRQQVVSANDSGLRSRRRTDSDGSELVETIVQNDELFGPAASGSATRVLTLPSGAVYQHRWSREVTTEEGATYPSSIVETIRINNQRWLRRWDGAVRSLTVTSPTDKTWTYSFDARAQLIGQARPGLTASSIARDEAGRVERIERGALSTNFVYDGAGRVASSTSPAGHVTSTTWDAAGRIASVDRAGLRSVSHSHDAIGRWTGFSIGGQSHSIDYQADAVRWTLPGGGEELQSIGPSGQIDSITTVGNQEVSRLREAETGRVLSVDAGGASITLSRNEAGRVETMTSSDGDALTLGYDGPLISSQVWTGRGAGRVDVAIGNNGRPASISVDGEAIALQYDGDDILRRAGDLTIARDGRTGLPSQLRLGGTTVTHRFDGLGRMTERRSNYPGARHQLDLTWDDDGNLSQRRELIDNVTTVTNFSYDALGRLVSASVEGGAGQTFGYDARDNTVEEDGQVLGFYEGDDRITRYGDVVVSNDAGGNVSQLSSDGGTIGLTHDRLGRLVAATTPAGNITYVLDGFGRRVARVVDGVVSEAYRYGRGHRLLAFADGNGAVVGRYIWGLDPLTPEVLIRDGVNYRLIKDERGSVRLVVNASTGEIAQRIDYDLWGQITANSAPAFQPLGFAGGLYDAATGLHHFGRRDYSAAIRRWTSRDPMRFDGGSLNLFAYAGGNPVSRVDPQGTWSLQIGLTLGGSLGPVGVGGSSGIYLTVDDVTGDWEIGTYNTGSAGLGAGASADVGLEIGLSTSDCGEELAGAGVSGGGSGGAVVSGGVDVTKSAGGEDGVTANIGFGAGAEIHANATYTVTHKLLGSR